MGDTPPVPATPPAASTPKAPAAPAAAVDPQVQSCLDLIAQAKFQEALPVCLAAAQIAPDNQQVQDALATARAETAAAAAAAAAGQAATDEAAGGAAGMMNQ